MAGLLAALGACLPRSNDKNEKANAVANSSKECRKTPSRRTLSGINFGMRDEGMNLRNGAVARSDEFPSVGMLYFADKEKSSVCSGTLVCSDVVMTAAHCFDGMAAAGYTFHLGSEIFANGSAVPGDRQRAPRGVTARIRDSNALASSVATGADLAFLKLDRKVAGPKAVLRLDKLSEGSLARESIGLTLVGFGNNADDAKGNQTGAGTKRYGQMRLVAYEVADTDPSGLQLGILDPISSDRSVKSCHGDSGGPAFLGEDVYGVVAVSDKSCQSGTLTAVALVPENADWIRANLEDLCSAEDNPVLVSRSHDAANATSSAEAHAGDSALCD